MNELNMERIWNTCASFPTHETVLYFRSSIHDTLNVEQGRRKGPWRAHDAQTSVVVDLENRGTGTCTTEISEGTCPLSYIIRNDEEEYSVLYIRKGEKEKRTGRDNLRSTELSFLHPT